MRSLRFGLWLIFFFAASGGTIAVTNPRQDIVVERATEEEAQQVQKIADAFERRMRETRDVGTLKDLFLDDFVRLQRQEEQAERPGQPVMLIPSMPLSIESDLAAQVTRLDWERFYTARLNFRYYFVLLLASRTTPSDLKQDKPAFQRKLFPAEVLKLMKADPFLSGEYSVEGDPKKYKIESMEELRSLIATLEQATLILRQRFLEHPPEQTRTYQENVRQGPKEHKTRREGLIWPHVYGTGESRRGFPKGTRHFHRITADSLFELWFVKTESGMKIVWAQVYPFN